MGVVDDAITLRSRLISEEGTAVPESFSGISKEKIARVLEEFIAKLLIWWMLSLLFWTLDQAGSAKPLEVLLLEMAQLLHTLGRM